MTKFRLKILFKNVFFWIITLSLISLILGLFFPITSLQFVNLDLRGIRFVAVEHIELISNPYKRHNSLGLIVTGSLKRKLLKTYPQIESIHVSFHYPRTLVITVKEKPPIMAFRWPQWVAIVSQDGYILTRIPQPVPSWVDKLPFVEGFDTAYIAKDRIHPKMVQDLGKLYSSFYAFFPQSRFDVKLKHWNPDPLDQWDDWVLLKDRNLLIKMGTVADTENKLDRLRQFLNWTHSQAQPTPNSVDLRVTKKVFASYGPSVTTF